MRKILLLGWLVFPLVTLAQDVPEGVRLVFDDQVVKLNFNAQEELLERHASHVLTLGGVELPVDFGNNLPPEGVLPVETRFRTSISEAGLERFLKAAVLTREALHQPVEIHKTSGGGVSFEGKAQNGYEVEEETLKYLIDTALEQKEAYVRVPARAIFSQVVVHPDLAQQGIKEIIAIGQSNFTGSSDARRQNIAAAVRKFNGVRVPQGKTFSFNATLGSVDEKDGFVHELVIKGADTEKELGGGVCQVSTTAFRAAFTGGLPITQRRNHSYAVPYYKPYGLDATIYLGAQDFRFKNDTPGDILIQAYTEKDDVYFVFYGTNDARQVRLEGPFITDYRVAPDPIVFETEDLPEGEMVEVSESHDGFRTLWVREVIKDAAAEPEREEFVSVYRPWPARVLRGLGVADKDADVAFSGGE